jgi:hypothetical protein
LSPPAAAAPRTDARPSPFPPPALSPDLSSAHRIALASALGLFLALSLWNIDGTGLDGDEIRVGSSAAGIHGHRQLLVMAREIPLLNYDRHGAMLSYWVYPFMKLPGGYVARLRLPMVLCGFLTLLALHAFARRYFGAGTALTAVFLTAVHPSFVLGSQLGTHHGVPLLLCSLLSALFLTKWLEGRSALFLAAAAFFCGVGFSSLSWYVFWMAALGVALLIAWRTTVARLAAGPAAAGFAALAGFLVGAWPIVLNELLGVQSLFAMPWAVSRSKLASGSWSDLFSLGESLRGFLSMAAGTGFADHCLSPTIWEFSASAWPYAAGALFIVPVAFRFLSGRDRSTAARRILLLLALVLAYLAAAAYNPTAMVPNHHFTILPWHVLLVSAALVRFSESFRRSWLRRTCIGFSVSVAVAAAATVHGQYWHYQARTGGTDFSSSGLRDLCDWIAAQPYREVLSVNRPAGLGTQLWPIDRESVRVSALSDVTDLPPSVQKPSDPMLVSGTDLPYDAYVVPWTAGWDRLPPDPSSDNFGYFESRRRDLPGRVALRRVIRELNQRPAYLVYEPRRAPPARRGARSRR